MTVGAGWARKCKVGKAHDRRIMSLISPGPLACGDAPKYVLTSDFACSTMPTISRLFAVRRGAKTGPSQPGESD